MATQQKQKLTAETKEKKQTRNHKKHTEVQRHGKQKNKKSPRKYIADGHINKLQTLRANRKCNKKQNSYKNMQIICT